MDKIIETIDDAFMNDSTVHSCLMYFRKNGDVGREEYVKVLEKIIVILVNQKNTLFNTVLYNFMDGLHEKIENG